MNSTSVDPDLADLVAAAVSQRGGKLSDVQFSARWPDHFVVVWKERAPYGWATSRVRADEGQLYSTSYGFPTRAAALRDAAQRSMVLWGERLRNGANSDARS